MSRTKFLKIIASLIIILPLFVMSARYYNFSWANEKRHLPRWRKLAPLKTREKQIIPRSQTNTNLSVSNMKSGFSSATLNYQSQTRNYLLYIPNSYNPKRTTSLVIALHGGRGTGERFARTTGFNQLAEQEGFIVVYPNGIDNHWNDNRNAASGFDTQIDDVGFISTLIDTLEKNLNIDPRRIYATGISNGGFFTQRLACELSNRIAALASVAATLPVNFRCKANRPVPILMIASPNDRFVPWEGGIMWDKAKILSVADTIEFWRQHNRCDSQPQRRRFPRINRRDQTEVESNRFVGCQSNANVELLTIIGGGHTWPGGQDQPRLLVGPTTSQINGSQFIWNFFKAHPLP